MPLIDCQDLYTHLQQPMIQSIQLLSVIGLCPIIFLLLIRYNNKNPVVTDKPKRVNGQVCIASLATIWKIHDKRPRYNIVALKQAFVCLKLSKCCGDSKRTVSIRTKAAPKTYVVGTQKKRLNETVLLSTQNMR